MSYSSMIMKDYDNIEIFSVRNRKLFVKYLFIGIFIAIVFAVVMAVFLSVL